MAKVFNGLGGTCTFTTSTLSNVTDRRLNRHSSPLRSDKDRVIVFTFHLVRWIERMHQRRGDISLQTDGRGLYVSTKVRDWVASTGISEGLLTLFIAHTSASLMIQENDDPDVLRDMERFFDRLVPQGDPLYRHTAEGPDDMPAHVRMALTQVSLSIPVSKAQPSLGTWQGIFLYEHRTKGRLRTVSCHITGD